MARAIIVERGATPISEATLEDILGALMAAGVTTVEQFQQSMMVFGLDQTIADKQAEIARAQNARDAQNATAQTVIAVLESELQALRAQRVG